MKRFIVPAAVALSMVSTAMPASAVEGTLDGVVYSLPEGSRFELQTLHLPEPDKLQEKVDELRAKAPPDSLLILFRSRPFAKDAPLTLSPTPTKPKGTPKAQPILSLFREPTKLADYRIAIDRAVKDASFRDGVAKITVKEPVSDKAMFARSYAVRTGLVFAPDADVHCNDLSVGTRCFVEVARPGRLRLRWNSIVIDETSPQAVKSHVRDLIAKALPVEMEKEAKKPQRRP